MRAHKRLSEEEKAKIKKLAQEGLSLEGISSILDVGKSTVYYHAKQYCRKQATLNLDALAMKEKGYILGIFVGDGNLILRARNGQYGIKITLDKNNDQDIAGFMHTLFRKAGKKTLKRIEENSLCLRAFSIKLVEFVLDYVSITKKDNSQRNVKSLINWKDWPLDFKIGFVSGLIDSDGYVYHSKSGKHYGAVIKTNNQSLGNQIQSILGDLRFNASIHAHEFHGTYETKSLCYNIYIPSKEMWRSCQDLISVKHARHH